MTLENAAKRAANNKDPLPSEKWLAAFAYGIPKQLWGLGDAMENNGTADRLNRFKRSKPWTI